MVLQSEHNSITAYDYCTCAQSTGINWNEFDYLLFGKFYPGLKLDNTFSNLIQ